MRTKTNPLQVRARVIKDSYGFTTAGNTRLINCGFRVLRQEFLYANAAGDELVGFFPAGSQTYQQGAAYLTLDCTVIQDPVTHQIFWVQTGELAQIYGLCDPCCNNAQLLSPLLFDIINQAAAAFDISTSGLGAGESYDVSIDGGTTWLVLSVATAIYHVTGVTAGNTYNVVLKRKKAGYTPALSPVNTFVL